MRDGDEDGKRNTDVMERMPGAAPGGADLKSRRY